MPNAIVRASATPLPKAYPLSLADFDPVRDFLDDPSILPDRYAVYVHGQCLAPEISDGRCAMIDKTAPYAPGDIVVVYLRRDAVPAGKFQSLLKRLVMAPPPWVTFPWREAPDSEVGALVMLEQRNPRQQFVLRCADILGIHKCTGLVTGPEPLGSHQRREA